MVMPLSNCQEKEKKERNQTDACLYLIFKIVFSIIFFKQNLIPGLCGDLGSVLHLWWIHLQEMSQVLPAFVCFFLSMGLPLLFHAHLSFSFLDYTVFLLITVSVQQGLNATLNVLVSCLMGVTIKIRMPQELRFL